MSLSLHSLLPDSSLDARRPSLASELAAFLIVGGALALCFIILSTVLIEFRTGVPAWVVSAACYAALIVPAYVGHRRFSFRSALAHRVAFPRYVAVQLSAVALAALFSFVCYSVLGMATAVAAFIVAGLTAGVNFFVLKLWAFATHA